MTHPASHHPDAANEPADSLFEFPCDFPLKIMGHSHDSLTPTLLEIVLRHAPDFDIATVSVRPSSSGKYTSLTCIIRASSRQQLDALYQELTSHPMVKVVL